MKKSLYISAMAFCWLEECSAVAATSLIPSNKTTGNIDADNVLSKEPQSILYSAYNALNGIVTEVALNDEGTDLYVPVRGKTASAYDQYTLNAEDKNIYSYWKNLYQHD